MEKARRILTMAKADFSSTWPAPRRMPPGLMRQTPCHSPAGTRNHLLCSCAGCEYQLPTSVYLTIVATAVERSRLRLEASRQPAPGPIVGRTSSRSRPTRSGSVAATDCDTMSMMVATSTSSSAFSIREASTSFSPPASSRIAESRLQPGALPAQHHREGARRPRRCTFSSCQLRSHLLFTSSFRFTQWRRLALPVVG